jgi:hypothetical protein
MLTKTSSRILWSSLLLGICFDILFWKKAPGISFFLFIALLTAACFGLGYWNGRKPAVLTWVLAGMTLLFSAFTFIRQEPFTTFINILLTLCCLALLALTFSSGIWLRYSLADVVTGAANLAGATLAGGSTLLAAARKSEAVETDEQPLPKKKTVSVWAVVRGLLLAFPVVFFLALLLVSADPVFSSELKKILDIERFMEYAVRLAMVCIIAYLLSGTYNYVIEKSGRKDLIGLEKPWFPAFLGFTESTIILTSVNLLFAFFVAVQFKYFFGGQSNIMPDGYTYAEYARKGFGELVWVAVLSLMLFMGLSAVTRRDSAGKQHWFSGLSLALVGLVGVILVSSFMRLSLLESAYGFSRLRTYSHVFMVWLGILLVTVLVLEIINYRRGFAMAAFLVLTGLGLTLNVLNVDGFIVRANVERAINDDKLDYTYFQELSTDAIPETLNQYRSVKDAGVREMLGVSLTCREAALEDQLKDWQWQGYNYSYNTALLSLRDASPELKDYQINRTESGEWRTYSVITPTGEKDCYANTRYMD